MRALFIILFAIVAIAPASAQSNSAGKPAPGDSPHSTGRTYLPTDAHSQPQGSTGPLETGSGGAPAASPQGQSPPGMQAAPEGSSKTIVTPAAPQH